MPSPFSTDRRALCQHADYREGCLSCKADDMRISLQEAVTESSNRAESMRAYEADLADPALRASDKERLAAKLERVTKQRAEWDERCQVLKEMVASVEAQVKDVCDCTDPNALSEAFEHSAMEHEDKLRQIWRKAAKSEGDAEFVRFVPEDPTYELSFKDVDRSNIPATTDTLKLSNKSVGDQTDPAIMSHGRALEMFGVPAGPGKDWRQASEPSTEPVEREMLAQVDVTKTTSKAEKQEATAEYEQREQRRATIISQLEAWVPPPGFDDGLSSHQPPTHFYTGTPLGILDAKKLGLDLEKLGLDQQPAKR